jgi:hypothetical protein
VDDRDLDLVTVFEYRKTVSGVVPGRVRFSVVPFAVAIVAGGPAGCLERRIMPNDLAG